MPKPQETANLRSNWNVSGARLFQAAREFPEQDLPSPATAHLLQLTLVVPFIQFAHNRFQCELRLMRGADFGC
jgi:hypothetical protein